MSRRADPTACPWAFALLGALSLAVGLAACGDDREGLGGSEDERSEAVASGRFQLVPSPDVGGEVADARLGFREPENGARFQPGEAVPVAFRLSGYELGVPTEGPGERGIARSDGGQHLHLVLNNEPYRAVYDADEGVVLQGLPEGTHVLRTFPGLDWHESVKAPGAFSSRVFQVGEGEIQPPEELTGPLLTYSRPVGEYEGAAADSILVDFHLSGVRLSPEGYRVRITVTPPEEEPEQWILTRWEPHLLVGLPEGEHTVRVELLDPEGVPVPGALNGAERTIRVRR
ncbi:MAG: hypothetical protein ACOCUZ_00870 [bacterium]